MSTVDAEWMRKILKQELADLEAKYCNDVVAGLCKGRHQLPDEVTEYVFPQEVDPLDVEGMTKTASQFLEDHGARSLILYVTGLTVACIAVCNACKASCLGVKLTLMHYNRENGEYYPQEVW